MASSPVAVLIPEPAVAQPDLPEPPSAGAVGVKRALPALLAVYIIWGSTYLGMRIALQGFPPLTLSGVRFIIAGAALLGFLVARGSALPDRRQWLAAAPVGVLLFVGGNGFVALGQVHISSGVAAVVVATMPLWMGLFAVIGGERPSAREWAGIALGFGAVAILSTGGDLRANFGATVVLMLSPLSWAAGSMLARRSPSGRGGLLAVVAAQTLLGGVVALALGLLLGERMTGLPGTGPLLALVYLIVFGSLVGFTAYSWLLRNVRPVLATSYAFVNPLLAVALGALLAGEALGWATLVAAPAVAIAVALAVTARGKPRGRARPVPARLTDSMPGC
jgi:drug/metabolite transporter (DMT)-like permease